MFSQNNASALRFTRPSDGKPSFDGPFPVGPMPGLPPSGSPPEIPFADVSAVKRKFLDIPYASLSPAQKLDIYLPDGGEGPFPVIFVIHGGGFEIGNRRDVNLFAFLNGIDRGFAVVSTGYRLSHEAIFPAAVQDIKAAVRWIRANQDQYHLDGNRIAACGGSAGGNLAAMLGVTGSIQDFDNPDLGNIEMSSAVQAVVDWFGPLDFLAMDGQHAENGRDKEVMRPASSAMSAESKYLGKPVNAVPDLAKKANPATYIHSEMPPFFIQHGKADVFVPYQQSENFAAEIKHRSPETFVYLELLETAGHGDVQFESEENMNKVFRFLEKCLL